MKHFICIIILFSSLYVQAQQLPLFSQYQGGNAFTNPAALSDAYLIDAYSANLQLTYRRQWTGLAEAPRTLLANYDYFNEDYSFLVGGGLIRDQTGPTGFTGAYARAGYGIRLSNELLLTIGLSGGLVQYQVRGDELEFLEDDVVGSQRINQIYPDFGFGAVLYIDDRFYLGFSSPQTFGLVLDFRDEDNQFSIKRAQHYYGMAGAHFPLYDDSYISLKSWVKYLPEVPLHMDANLRYAYRQSFWVGVGGSTAGSLSLEAGLMFPLGGGDNLTELGYAFSNYFTSYGAAFGGVHEIRIAMGFL